MARFPGNDIISLIGQIPRYDLGESVGPDLRLGDVLDASAQRKLGEVALGYRTAQGDPRLRQLIADAHGVSPDDVVVTVGGMHALFLIAFVLCDRGDEAVTVSPMFPLARNTRAAVGAEHSNRFAVVRSRLPVRPRRHRSTPLGANNAGELGFPSESFGRRQFPGDLSRTLSH